jgi:hypothetical protein
MERVVEMLLEGVLVLVLPAVFGLAVAWLRVRQRELLMRLDEADRRGREGARVALGDAVALGVEAAEQGGLVGLIAKEGARKKEYAVGAAERYLRTFGVEVDVGVVGDLVEAEVLRQFPRMTTDGEGVEGTWRE